MGPEGSAQRSTLFSRGSNYRSAGALHGGGVNPRTRSDADARRSAARGLGLDRAVRRESERESEADADSRCDLLRTRRPKGHPAREGRTNAQEDWNLRPPRHREDGRDQSISRALRQDQGRLARFAKLCGRTGLATSTTADWRDAGSGVVNSTDFFIASRSEEHTSEL